MFLLPHAPHDAWRRKNVAIDLIFFLSTRRVPSFSSSRSAEWLYMVCAGCPGAGTPHFLDSNGVPRAWVRLILDSNGVPRAWVRLILDSNGVRRVRVRLIGVSNNKSEHSLINI